MTKAFFIIWLISVLTGDTETPNDLSNTLGHLDNKTLEVLEYAFVHSSQNNINPEKFIRLMYCESQFVPRGGDWNAITNQYESWGILQFQFPTFQNASHNSNIKGKYKNSYTQIELAVWIINNDPKGTKHWYTCGERAKFHSNKKVASR